MTSPAVTLLASKLLLSAIIVSANIVLAVDRSLGNSEVSEVFVALASYISQ